MTDAAVPPRHARRGPARERDRPRRRDRRATRWRRSPQQPRLRASKTSRRGIMTIAAANMANAIREITVEQGQDPRTHDADRRSAAPGRCSARCSPASSRSTEIVVPPYAGNFSAWGLLGADLTQTAARTRIMDSRDAAIAEGERVLARALRRARAAARDGAASTSARSGSTCATSARSTRSRSRARATARITAGADGDPGCVHCATTTERSGT